ncbi:MAG: hypothetical protein AB1445_15435 [Bacillota bacterium]
MIPNRQFTLTVEATRGVRVRVGSRVEPGTVTGWDQNGRPIICPVQAKVMAVGFDPENHALVIALEEAEPGG